YGFYILLNWLIYMFIINLLNCLFVYDDHLESTDENQEFGPIFSLCKTIRHILFWTYGLYTQILVICIGIIKVRTAIAYEMDSFYVPRVCFLIWSVISF
ncbi:hypothetical protein ACI65C_006428, partial [Semiaphis heraclei]